MQQTADLTKLSTCTVNSYATLRKSRLHATLHESDTSSIHSRPPPKASPKERPFSEHPANAAQGYVNENTLLHLREKLPKINNRKRSSKVTHGCLICFLLMGPHMVPQAGNRALLAVTPTTDHEKWTSIRHHQAGTSLSQAHGF